MLREIPSRAWKSSNRRTPKNASRTINRLHHSPTTSRHWATEQFMSSKLLRCTPATLVSCIIERKPLILTDELPAGSEANLEPVHERCGLRARHGRGITRHGLDRPRSRAPPTLGTDP